MAGGEVRAPSEAEEALVIPAIAADGSLFPMGKIEAHRQGQKHLAVSVFVFGGDRLLIQQRADGKYHCGGLWANTCCTHPHWGETPADCAHRRLKEELGFAMSLNHRAVVDYRANVGNGLIENERVHIFRGQVDKPFEVDSFDRNEVQDLMWIEEAALQAQVSREPQRFTPWIRIYLERWSELALRSAA